MLMAPERDNYASLTPCCVHAYCTAGALRPAGDLSSCSPDDFKVKPRQGDAILFWNLNHDLTVNPRSLHGACPVVKGEK